MTAPVPVPHTARRVLLFGGSFDPPHVAHVELPELVRTKLNADHVLYVPAARSPHKPHAPGASPRLRTAMLRAALAHNPRASIWTFELDRAALNPTAPSFTIDTLRELRRQRPEIQPGLLIGADQARAFHLWREPSAIIRLAPPAVMLRGDHASPEGASELINHLTPIWGREMARRWASWIVPVPVIDLSATRIREALARFEPRTPDPELLRALPAPVLETLARDNPYRTSP